MADAAKTWATAGQKMHQSEFSPRPGSCVVHIGGHQGGPSRVFIFTAASSTSLWLQLLLLPEVENGPLAAMSGL